MQRRAWLKGSGVQGLGSRVFLGSYEVDGAGGPSLVEPEPLKPPPKVGTCAHVKQGLYFSFG